MKAALQIVISLLFSISCFSPVTASAAFQSDSTSVTVITIDGTIGPTTTNYINRGLEVARERNDEALVIQLNTPGGLMTSTQEIVQSLLASPIPVIVYVSPTGGNAGSAGTFITLAAHIAAMAPTTTIGAASPVTMGGATTDTVMQKKMFNFAESFIESIAQERGRNVEWAKSAVRDGESITEKEAVEINVVDLIAASLSELLILVDGKEVEGKILNTEKATIHELKENLAERFFSFIMRPEIMLILTLIAIYGIVGEITNPGTIIPGVAGVIALILLLYGSAALPINIAGFILIALAIILFIIEAFTPTFGILITGGAVAFFLGSIMLFQDFPEEMQLSWYWLVPATVLTVLFFVWVATAGIKSQIDKKSSSGKEAMIGMKAKVVEDISPEGGKIFVLGEYWNAVSNEKIKSGEWCEIVEINRLTAKVKSTT